MTVWHAVTNMTKNLQNTSSPARSGIQETNWHSCGQGYLPSCFLALQW